MTMEFEQILTIMEKFEQSKCAYLDFETGDVRLKLKKQNQVKRIYEKPLVDCESKEEIPSLEEAPRLQKREEERTPKEDDLIKTPLVGVFYEAVAPDKPAYVSVGSRVKKGDTVCLIEAMKMMNEVKAPKDGIIKEILVENAQLVEYDAPLFVLEE